MSSPGDGGKEMRTYSGVSFSGAATGAVESTATAGVEKRGPLFAKNWERGKDIVGGGESENLGNFVRVKVCRVL